jgi:hypothetical protein
MRRVLLLVAVAALVCAPAAGAWTWPTNGEVLQPFVFDRAHPYAAGEHRGLDVAAAAGDSVLAPRAGTITFAGSVPGSGLSVTIATDDGYAVTLTHLGSLTVARGAQVAEGGVVGHAGAGGDGEHPQPYVHLGVRIASEAQGYVDPAALLPARPAAPPAPAPAPPAATAAPAPAAAAPLVVAAPAAVPSPSSPAPVAPAVPATAAAAPEPAPAVPAAAAPGLVVRARPAPVTSQPVRVARPATAVTAAVAPAPHPAIPVRAPAPKPAAERHQALEADEIVAPRGYAAARLTHATARVSRQVAAEPARAPGAVPLLRLALLALAAAGAALAGALKATRIIDRHVDGQAQDPGGTGLAVRGWVPAPRPRRRVRAVRRVRPLSPAERERRPRGERDRRARHARDGGG